MENKNLLYIISLIGVFVFMHYYFTFDLLWYFLGKYNLDIASIISWEDIQFSIASINVRTFKGISFALLLIFVAFLPLMMTNVSKPIGFNVIRNKPKIQRKLIYSISIIVFFILISVILLFIIKDPSSIHLHICLILLIVGLVYYKYRRVDITVLIATFFLTTVIYNSAKKEGSILYSNDIKLILNDDKIIKSDSINKLIFLVLNISYLKMILLMLNYILQKE